MPNTDNTLEATLARHVVHARLETMGAAARAAAQLSVIDTLAAMVAGRAADGIDAMVSMVRHWGGQPQARVLLTGTRAPAPLAAWCNGAMARALELDDCVDALPLHPSAAVLPALVATADMLQGMSGKDFLQALVIAQDLKIRLGHAVTCNTMRSGRHNLFKVYAATAGVASAMRLNEAQTLNALGISASYAVGDGQCALDGSMALRVQFGNVAQGAIQAALLASQGVTGPHRFLTGRFGYFTAFEPEHDALALTKNLGEEYRNVEISVKPYAACRATHAAIGLARELRAELASRGLGVDAIARIDIRITPEVDHLVGSPREAKIRPATGPAAQFSMHFVVASALLHDRVSLQDSAPEALVEPERLALAERIHVHPDDGQRNANVVGRTTVRVSLSDGTVLERSSEVPWGSPANPVDMAFLRVKLLDAARFAGHEVETGRLDQLMAAIADVEALPDVRILWDDFA